MVCSLRGDVLTGADPKDPWLPGANRLAPLQVQDADGEGQARHHAPDRHRGGGPVGWHGGAERRGAGWRRGKRRLSCQQAPSSPPLCCYGELESFLI